MECVQLATRDRTDRTHLRDTEFTAAIENLKARLTKEDGRKVEIILQCTL